MPSATPFNNERTGIATAPKTVSPSKREAVRKISRLSKNAEKQIKNDDDCGMAEKKSGRMASVVSVVKLTAKIEPSKTPNVADDNNSQNTPVKPDE